MKEQGQKIVAAGAAILAIEPVMYLSHFGGTGVIAGLAAGAIAYLVTEEVQQARAGAGEDDTPPAPVAPREKKPAPAGPRSLAYRLINGKSVRGGEDDEAGNRQPAPQNGLPRRSPTFAEMKHLIKPGQDILAFDGQKFITGVSFSTSVNMAIIGLPRHGKSTCLRFHLAQALVQNSIIRGWDTHGDVAGEFGELLNMAEAVPDILADCQWAEQELEQRNTLYKRMRARDPRAVREWSQLRPVLYIVDEFLVLSALKIKNKADRKIVTDTLLSLIAEGSKYKIRVILSGQSLPAKLFGETASSLRDIIGIKYAFASEDRQAQMIGIDPKAIEEFMPLIEGDDIKGYTIVAGGPLRNNILGSIPDTTFEDIAELLQVSNNAEFDEDDSELEDSEDDLPEGITEDDLDQIVQAFEAGWGLRDIIALVQMDLKTFKIACELVEIDITAMPTRQRPAIRPETGAAHAEAPVKLMPKPAAAGKPKADYPDAVRVWNELGRMGRPRLQKELQARGFECSDDLAKKLLALIEEDLKEQADKAVGGGGVAGGGGE